MISRKGLKRKLDKLFSEKVRSRGSCQRCSSTLNLQTAHIYTRKYLKTRWDPQNALCFCAGCHRWAHDRPLDFAEFVKEKIGTKEYNELRAKAQKLGKVDMEKILEEM